MFICGDFLSGAYVPRQGFNIADKDSRTVFSLRMASCNTQHEQRQPRSLNVPEILANVLQHVDSKTLLAAAQVNSLWADEATNVRKNRVNFVSRNMLMFGKSRSSGCGEDSIAVDLDH